MTWQYPKLSFYLVDFNEDDSLETWVPGNLGLALKNGKLKYFRSSGLVDKGWHCPLAKNTVHVAACDDMRDKDCVLVNLDGDNVFGKSWITQAVVPDSEKLVTGELTVVHYHNAWVSGTYGRMMYLKSQFLGIKGYDASFLPVGCQDTDLKRRLEKGGTGLTDRDPRVGFAVPNAEGGGKGRMPGSQGQECAVEWLDLQPDGLEEPEQDA